MENKKQYDFTSLNDFFNQFESPRQLADDVVQILFNYASLVNEDTLEQFRDDVCTLLLIYDELIEIEEKQ